MRVLFVAQGIMVGGKVVCARKSERKQLWQLAQVGERRKAELNWHYFIISKTHQRAGGSEGARDKVQADLICSCSFAQVLRSRFNPLTTGQDYISFFSFLVAQ